MFEISTNLETFSRSLSDIAERQFPYAMALALNDTAADVLEAVKDRIDLAFDRPTPYTRNAFAVVKRAGKADLEARIAPRDNRGAAHYLRVEEDGGPRPQTKMERMLGSTVASSAIVRSVLPGDNASLDRYGNWSSGERNRAISGIKGWREAGYSANQTPRSAKRGRSRGTYFVPQHGLTPGIYRRTGDVLDIIAIFSPAAPVYTPRFGFEEAAQKAAMDRIEGHFERRMAEAIATARWGG